MFQFWCILEPIIYSVLSNPYPHPLKMEFPQLFWTCWSLKKSVLLRPHCGHEADNFFFPYAPQRGIINSLSHDWWKFSCLNFENSCYDGKKGLKYINHRMHFAYCSRFSDLMFFNLVEWRLYFVTSSTFICRILQSLRHRCTSSTRFGPGWSPFSWVSSESVRIYIVFDLFLNVL